MKVTWKGTWWGGKKSIEWEGTIPNLRKKIPTFTCEDFRIGNAVNAYKYLIVREPLLSEVNLSGEVGSGDPDPMNSMFMPIEAVSSNYHRRLYRGRKQGYKLVEHHDVIDKVLGALKSFDSDSEEINLDSLEAVLQISVYGARMNLQFSVPQFKRDIYTLKLTCLNSVDRSIALTIDLSLHRGNDENDLPFALFHHLHTQEFRDTAITNFLGNELCRFLCGDWDKDPIPDPGSQEVKTILEKTLNSNEIKEVESSIEPGIGFLEFYKILSQLAVAGNKIGLWEKQRVRFGKAIGELHKLAEEIKKESNV